MDWIYLNCVTGKEERKTLVNFNAVQSVYYSKDSDLTVIDFIRSAYPPLYVRGNIMMDIRRLLSSHGAYVSTIGD